MTKLTAQEKFAALRQAVEDADFDPAREALDYAENNASDTIHVEKAAAAEDHYQLALDSIAWTSPFTDCKAVRDFLRFHGFEG
jgi:hypothetical protein